MKNCGTCEHFQHMRRRSGIKEERGICSETKSQNFSNIFTSPDAWKILEDTEKCEFYKDINEATGGSDFDA